MITQFARIFVLLSLVTMSGCLAANQQELTLQRDFNEMKRRLAETERGLAALRLERNAEMQERIEDLHRRTADQQASLDAFRVEFQSFYGRLEDHARTTKQLAADLGMAQDEFSIKVTALEDRLSTLEAAPTVQPAPAAQPATKPAAVPVNKIPADANPEEVYQAALKLLREQGEYAAARDRLGTFVAHFSDHPLRVNASYWIGEAYFAEKKFDQAILQFQQIIEKFPEHPKAPAALLMQGTAFHHMGDSASGKVILRQLLSKYPKAGEAGKAEARLAEWAKKK